MKIYVEKDTIQVRSMLETDVEHITNHLKHQGWFPDYDKFINYLHMQETHQRFIFIAEKANDVCGYVTLDPKPSYGPFKSLYPMVIDLNVFNAFQKQGVGSLLMDAAEMVAFSLSDHIVLGVGLHEGYGSAQKLYIKRGYIPDGSGVWYHDQVLKPYTQTTNDDDLNLYLVKSKHQ